MGSIITRMKCPCCSSIAIGKVLACKDYTVSGEEFEIWQCENCKIRFTQHVPDQDSMARYYQSDTYISHTDTEKGLVNKVYKFARNYTLQWKMKLVKHSLGSSLTAGTLLDIGSGTGAFLHRAFVSGWSVTGLEPDEGARKICRDKYGIEAKGPEKLFELPAKGFDVITMWHVLEHVHQLHEYMDEIKRLLKPGGAALIALPNHTSGDARLYGASWAAYDVPRHLYHFSPAAVNKLAGLHGLNVEAQKPMWLDAFYIAMLSEGYQNGKSNLINAVWNGLRSDIQALKNKTSCSSLVYIIRHKE